MKLAMRSGNAKKLIGWLMPIKPLLTIGIKKGNYREISNTKTVFRKRIES
jgi:hypothetical protein